MIHTNTPEHIRRKQSEIMRSKTEQERGAMAMEMYAMGRLALETRLSAKFPTMSYAELQGEIFRSMYRDRFPLQKMDKIVEAIVEWHLNHPSKL